MAFFLNEPIQVKNFNPTPHLVSSIKKSFDRLTELAPSDSHVNAVLEYVSGVYHCSININSIQKKFSVLQSAAKPVEALTGAVGAVLNDISCWKRSRFS